MTQNTQSEYYIGAFLVVISAITFSTAGLFTKGVEAGSWEVIFWRGESDPISLDTELA